MLLKYHTTKCGKFYTRMVQSELILFCIYFEYRSDDKLWLPLLLANKKFKGFFLFNADEKTILSHEVNEVDAIC
jgi:hypothetical protein